MALHTQLPIYKVAYDLLSVAADYVVNMPRAFKSVARHLIELARVVLRRSRAVDGRLTRTYRK